MFRSERNLERDLTIGEIFQNVFGDKKPDEMNYGEIKEIIEKYREKTKETMSETEKQVIHYILVSPQAKINEYIKEIFQ